MKIEWDKIEGYREDMTPEEKMALLESYEPEAPDPETPPAPAKSEPKPAPVPKKGSETISKVQFDKVASELAAARKQLRARMSEEEINEAKRQDEHEAFKLELETMRRDKTLSTYKAQYLALGYDEALASETAEAMADGDMDAVFLNMKKQGSAFEKTLRADILKETPTPPAGDNPDPKDTDLFTETFLKG